MAKSKEPWLDKALPGAIAGLFVLIVGKLLPLDQFAGEFSNLLRVFFVAMMLVFLWKAWRYYEFSAARMSPMALGRWTPMIPCAKSSRRAASQPRSMQIG